MAHIPIKRYGGAVPSGEQVVNYEMLYHLGDEFTSKTGGYVADNTKYNNGENWDWRGYRTNNTITMTEQKFYAFVSVKYSNGADYAFYISKNENGPLLYFHWTRNNVWNNFILSTNRTVTSKIVLGNRDQQVNNGSNKMIKNTNHLREQLSANTNYVLWYSFGKVNTDNLSGLSRYGNDITTILSNATDLFTDIKALRYITLNCTGDFMISALSNTNFKAAMNASPNKTILQANEHWARFLALLSI